MPRARVIKFSQKEIFELLRDARTVMRTTGLDIRLRPSTLAHGRILIITPRKMGNAPARNKIRRRLKAIYYSLELYSKRCDIIVFCKQASERLSFDQLKNLLCTALSQCPDQ